MPPAVPPVTRVHRTAAHTPSCVCDPRHEAAAPASTIECACASEREGASWQLGTARLGGGRRRACACAPHLRVEPRSRPDLAGEGSPRGTIAAPPLFAIDE